MTVKNLKNVAASVRQKLLNKARTGQRSFEEIAQHQDHGSDNGPKTG